MRKSELKKESSPAAQAPGRLRVFLCLALLFPAAARAAPKGNILDSLRESQETAFTLERHLKRDTASLLPDPSSNAGFSARFARAFDNKHYGEALRVYLSGLSRGPFARSATGRALYGLLLFQNGFEAEGLAELFEARPDKISPYVRSLWKAHAPAGHPAWNQVLILWPAEWTGFFDERTAFLAGISSLPALGSADRRHIEYLLRLPVSGSLDKFPAEWRLTLSFIREGDMDSATKVLGWLLKNSGSQKKRDMAHLAIARLLADAGERPAALFYYGKIPSDSPLYLSAQEEKAWIYHFQGRPRQALAAAAVFEYPGFKGRLAPKMLLALGFSQLKMCDYQGVSRALLQFKSRFAAGSAGYSRALLRRNSPLARLIRYRDFIGKKPAPAGAIFEPLRARRARLLQSLRKKTESLSQAALKKAAAEISAAAAGMRLVEAEALYRIHGFHKRRPPAFRPAGALFSAESRSGEGAVIFPFNPKEIWKDELPDYQALPRAEGCPKGAYIL